MFGFFSAFDLFGVSFRPTFPRELSLDEINRRTIENDWQMVGADMWEGYHQFENEYDGTNETAKGYQQTRFNGAN